jgi:hypothetical protein
MCRTTVDKDVPHRITLKLLRTFKEVEQSKGASKETWSLH